MRIAFSGTASTGKTTLIKELFKHKEFNQYNLKFLTTDARSILDSLGFKQMDLMTKEQTRHFQRIYFQKKIEIESNKKNIIVDRSFADVASYWLVRECDNNISIAGELIDKACRLSKEYDLHFYFPYGIIPFEDDGYRSRNETQRNQIGEQIKLFLNEWKIKFVQIDTDSLEKRVGIVLEQLSFLTSKYEQ
jgi:nicotinamide riboside kinase